jgi:hypothetical protein
MKAEIISIETAKIMAAIEKENKELQERIDKASEYIEKNSWYCCKDNKEELARLEIEELQKILKGE